MCERIDALQWMSSATKQKAKEKMQAMVFSIGAPERLFNADFQLTGTTAVEAGMQYMRQLMEYQRTCNGKATHGNGWDIMLANTYLNRSLQEIQAFYLSVSNELVIMPAFMLPEAFPADKDNAQRYAVAHIFGHELTHGFDADGAQYDAVGKKTNWWTDEDLARFKELQQIMIDRFNELDQAPGVKANGEKTLNENIADWGGVSLAYDLWCERLRERGLSGEALRHQQRQFFVSHADIKRAYCTDEKLAAMVNGDVHSANHNRVNGIDRLMDDWYTLFGVQPGDKLYVKPEDRVKIW
jgi:predicted metalloendopeptidase